MPKLRQSHIFDRAQHDHYVEEKWCSERLFANEDFTGPIYDPCCGWGRVLDAAKVAGFVTVGSDVVDRGASRTHNFCHSDFLKKSSLDWEAVGSFVSNPPFDQIEDIARRCVELAKHKVALICPLRRLPAAHSWLSELPLSKILIMTPRPSMPTGEHIASGGKVGGGTQDYVWLIMKKDYHGPVVTAWLHRDA
jgi:hypothetical protein